MAPRPAGKPTSYPGFIAPSLATLRAKPPAGAGWLTEVKFDGYRAQVHVQDGRVRAFSRTGVNYSKQFRSICSAAEKLKTASAIIDGEAVAHDEHGYPNFDKMPEAIARNPGSIILYAFDLLYLDGQDLRPLPLIERRAELARLIGRKPPPNIIMSKVIEGDPARIFASANELGLEGLVMKRANAPYRSGRSDSWVKIKCVKSRKLAIIGFIPAGAHSIAALRLARRDGDTMVYVGKAGTGFSVKTAREIRTRLEPLRRATAAVRSPLRRNDTVWVDPSVEAMIQFNDVTSDGMLRGASFKGLVDPPGDAG